jgi:2-methylisocitrate lyase-like PEP mutase family enzyme
MADAPLKSTLLKTALAEKRFILAPGVYDLISARVADTMGFTALYATGFGMVASDLGLPDAGIATYTDMLRRVATIAKACRTPLIADADTGYGGLLNVHHTVQGYEDAGVAVIQIEDQEFPKKCGHTPGRRVIPMKDMCRKIEVAVAARRSDNFLIMARTDARTSHGLDEAIARGQAYRRAGADIVFVESPETEDEMARIGGAIEAPLLANLVEGGRTPILTAARLHQLGYAVAIYPGLGFLTAAAAVESAYAHLKAAGTSDGMPTPSYGFGRICETMGFPAVWAFDQRWAETE